MSLWFIHVIFFKFRKFRLYILIGYLLIKSVMSTRYDHPDWLASISFNPLLRETYKKFILCSDHDPDAHFFSSKWTANFIPKYT